MFLTALVLLAQAAPPLASPQGNAPDAIVPRAWLVIAPVDNAGRRPFRPDAVFAKHLLDPHAQPPKKDEVLTGEIGKEQRWQERTAKDDGAVEGEPGWAYTSVESPIERVMMAQLSGAGRLFVNGAGFAGDLYAYGFGGVPVALRKGSNDLYVNGVRGSFRLKLTAPDGRFVVGSWDVTKSDLVAGESFFEESVCVPLFNATNEAASLVGLSYGDRDRKLFNYGVEGALKFAPLSVRKHFFPMTSTDRAVATAGTVRFHVYSNDDPRSKEGRELLSVDIDVRKPGGTLRRTHGARADDSVQEYSVVPAKEPAHGVRKAVLSLHGAGVGTLGQAQSYSQKSDFTIVVPSNRRPFGFDWQDWGRTDAYEAMEAWTASDRETPVAWYLTGHSMGGHGTWHLAANDPDRFVAIAPSAGWSSFDSYGGRPHGALEASWHGADGASDTLSLISNLAQIPTFILHGTADDNVPVGEAKKMQKALEDAGAKPQVHYQEGAGHWWDGDAAPGVDCVDWPGIFELFRQAKPREPSLVLDFATADPGIDSNHEWIEVLQPLEYGKVARVRTSFDKASAESSITTENVRRFRFHEVPAPGPGKSFTIDGRKFAKSAASRAEFVRALEGWSESKVWTDERSTEKTPEVSGPFKRAFDWSFCLVYGTHGSADENRELLERARFDLETWWYRANGTPDLLSDQEFLADYLEYSRNVILYGNADTNAAWAKLVDPSCPIAAKRGALKLGDREWKGDDLGAVFVFPRTVARKNSNSVRRLVGAFADTGVRGTRLGYTLAPFVSGVGYPDYALYSSDVLAKGDGGVLAAGWFDATWKLDGRGYLRPEETAEKPEKR